MAKSTQRSSPWVVRALLCIVLVAASVACSAGRVPPVPVRWIQVPPEGLAQGPSQPYADAVQAGGDGRPWLIGGVVIIPEKAHPEGLVTTPELRQVVIWQAASPFGPWVPARMRIGDPSFEGLAGETPLGEGIADGQAGVLLAATAEAPTRSNPTMTHGALWYSATGHGWTRVSAPGLKGSETTVRAVVSAGNGWLVAGTVEHRGRRLAAVWPVSSRQSVGPPQVLPGTGAGPLDVTAEDADRSQVIVAGVSDGRPVIWVAGLGRHDAPARWRREETPPGGPADLQRVAVSMSADGTIIALVGKSDSVTWHT